MYQNSTQFESAAGQGWGCTCRGSDCCSYCSSGISGWSSSTGLAKGSGGFTCNHWIYSVAELGWERKDWRAPIFWRLNDLGVRKKNLYMHWDIIWEIQDKAGETVGQYMRLNMSTMKGSAKLPLIMNYNVKINVYVA